MYHTYYSIFCHNCFVSLPYFSFLLITTSSFMQNKMGLRGTLVSQKKKKVQYDFKIL